MASTVLITGASSGIGNATVRYFQARGWNVVATMRRPEQATELSLLPRVISLRLDVLDEALIASAIAQGQATFGRIDVVVNNSESLHYELRPFGIRVKLIEPGVIQTDFYGRSQTVCQQPGLTAYDTYQTPVLAAMHQAGATGSPPEVVAQTIFRAATDRSSRMRYPVGGNAPLLLALRWLLPDRWFQAMVRRSLEPR